MYPSAPISVRPIRSRRPTLLTAKSRSIGPRIGLHGIILSAVLLGAAPLVQATHVGEDVTADQQVVASSDQLVTALRQYENTPAAARAALTPRLTLLASQRRDRMLALLARNPAIAAARLMPGALRERLPEAARIFVEQEVQLAGRVSALIADDFARGRSRQQFFLDTAQGRLELHLADPRGGERDLLGWVGKGVTIAASRLDGHLLIHDKRRVQIAAAGGTTATTGPATTASTTVVQGDQTTLAILLNFTDKAIATTPGEVGARLFAATNSVNDMYRQSSGGMVSFSGQAVGPFTINYLSTGSCDYFGFAAAANAAATAAGYNLAAYKRVSYVLPAEANCGWIGLAIIGGAEPTMSWVKANTSTGVFAHELGHNLLFNHAATPTSNYGDESDPMGGTPPKIVQANGANRVMAGWVTGARVQDVVNGGSYALVAIEGSGATSPQVLRVGKPDTVEQYYVSLRQPVGYDTNLASGYLNTLSVHRATGTLPTKTYLLANLAVGQTYTDSVNGIQFTHQALAGSTSTVGVTLGSGATCVRSAPTISASPASQTAAPGAVLAYNASVTNNNSSACGASSFNLTQALPAGFSGSFTVPSVSVAAGASVNVGWSVASATAAADATYALSATASESSVVNSGQAHASYTVYREPALPPPPPADTTPPVLAITSPAGGALLSGRSVSITASASDGSGVAKVEFFVDGTLLASDASSPYSANWTLRKVAAGAHTLRVRATDAKGNASEQSIGVTVK